MENNNLNFFGKEGLTNTSANYIANIAKEKYQSLESELINIQLYNVALKLLGTSEEEIISKATEHVIDIPNKLEDIAKCKALIAWLREAIKEKDRLNNEANCYSFIMWCEDNDCHLKNPICEPKMTEDEYLNSLSVKDRNRWLTLEAFTSTIGQAIHKNGSLSNARNELIKVMQKPIKTQANGRDTLIYKRTPVYTDTEIENLFFSLQTKHREAQAELNSMKHKMEITIEEDIAKKRKIYEEKLKEYENKQKEYYIKWQEYLDNKKKEIRELKIIIPNNLRDIYNKINNLGK